VQHDPHDAVEYWRDCPVSVRKAWVSLSRVCPYADIFRAAVANLRGPPIPAA